MGENIQHSNRIKLFPGLLPILLSLVAVLFVEPIKTYAASAGSRALSRERWLGWLDGIIMFLFVVSLLAIGFDGSDYFISFFRYVTSERALALLTVAIIARLCIAYPSLLKRGENANLIQTLRSPRRGDAFWVGLVLTVVGFYYSLGWNFFFYRICYDLLLMFRSMRAPLRGSMFAYLGLALLAGLGTKRLAEIISKRKPRVRPATVFVVTCGLLLFELNGAPLKIVRGDVFPDAVTLRLKETPMRGGLVVLPAGGDVNHRHILRSADHQKPLIVGTSGFNSPYQHQIEAATGTGAISDQFLDLLESIPTSYVVVQNHLIAPERRVDYENFLARAVQAGRLRFINRFDGRDDLYAVVKIEPEAKTEGQLPFAVELKKWNESINENLVNVVGQYRAWTQTLYRFYVASFGEMPRYSEFLRDVELIGRGVVASSPDELPKLEANLKQFAERWIERPKFQERYKAATNERFVDELAANAGITLADAERTTLIDQLNQDGATRGQVLLAIVYNPGFVQKEDKRSLVLLHYFGYLHRNPDDPPDKDLEGFNYWLKEVEGSGEIERLTRAFMASGENKASGKK